MLDYNTLNNLVEAFNKNGISNVKLENGSTLEIKEGQLLINGEPLSIDIGVINTDNITGLSTETIESLKAGDLVLKHTGNQIHAYKVTYKEEHQGICISYYNAGYSETVSYDYVDNAWVYNSTDVVTPTEYSAGTGIKIEDNTIKSKLRIACATGSINNPITGVTKVRFEIIAYTYKNFGNVTAANFVKNIIQGGWASEPMPLISTVTSTLSDSSTCHTGYVYYVLGSGNTVSVDVAFFDGTDYKTKSISTTILDVTIADIPEV